MGALFIEFACTVRSVESHPALLHVCSETNLKIKQALEQTLQFNSPGAIQKMGGSLVCEESNKVRFLFAASFLSALSARLTLLPQCNAHSRVGALALSSPNVADRGAQAALNRESFIVQDLYEFDGQLFLQNEGGTDAPQVNVDIQVGPFIHLLCFQFLCICFEHSRALRVLLPTLPHSLVLMM